MHITDINLLTQLSALADHDSVPVSHIVEFACYQYLMELMQANPNLVHAVPELCAW